MKFKKLIIPIIAAVALVGMSFANSNEEIETPPVANDYVYDNGNWQAIPEQQCTGGSQTCRVQFGTNGPIYELYDEMDLNTLKKESVDGDPIVIQP